MQHKRIATVLAVALAALLAASCTARPATSPPVTYPSGGTFASNGERIYFTATSASGQPITYSGGVMMMVLACANCHGADGHGGQVRMMMYSFDVPDITWPVLTTANSDRPAYTEQGVKDAITEGLDSEGGRLEAPMPVWHMSEGDLNDLIAFLKTLK